MITREETRRLAFIKYLHNLGMSQAKQPEPLNSSAVLMFHDATELFLQLASEHFDVGKARIDFVEYWTFSTRSCLGTAFHRESQ